MNAYEILKGKQQKEVNNFPMMFAFSNKQFNEGMAKLGLKPDETDKIYKFGNTGGYYLKSDATKLHEMFDRHEKEMKDAIESDLIGEGFIYDMFYYELANHEYIITGCFSDTIEALGLNEDEVYGNERLMKGINKAAKEIRKHNA